MDSRTRTIKNRVRKQIVNGEKLRKVQAKVRKKRTRPKNRKIKKKKSKQGLFLGIVRAIIPQLVEVVCHRVVGLVTNLPPRVVHLCTDSR